MYGISCQSFEKRISPLLWPFVRRKFAHDNRKGHWQTAFDNRTN